MFREIKENKNPLPDFTGYSPQLALSITIEDLKDKLKENKIEMKSLDKTLNNKSGKDLQIIYSLIIELTSQRILNEKNIETVLKDYLSLRYLIDAFYAASHRYFYTDKFSLAKDSHFKGNYWSHERDFIKKLFHCQVLLPTLAEYLQQSTHYDPEIIVYPEKFDKLMNTTIYNRYQAKQPSTELPTEEDFIDNHRKTR